MILNFFVNVSLYDKYTHTMIGNMVVNKFLVRIPFGLALFLFAMLI
jgi:hypothetical protein